MRVGEQSLGPRVPSREGDDRSEESVWRREEREPSSHRS